MSRQNRGRIAFIVLLSFLVFGAGLHTDLGGFNAFSAGYYLLLGNSYSWGSLLSPFVEGAGFDYMIPPLYGWIVFLLRTPLAVKVFSLLCGVGSVYLVYLLGGWKPALVFLSLPAVIILSTTIFPDMLLLFLLLLALTLYQRGRLWYSAVVLGFALLTKQPALIMIVVLAYDLYVSRRDGFGLSPSYARVVWFLVVCLLPSIIFFDLQLAANYADVVEQFTTQGGRGSVPSLGLLLLLARELAFMCGVWWLFFWRGSWSKLERNLFIAYFLFGLYFHVHPYYFLPTLPFFALRVGRSLTDNKVVFISQVSLILGLTLVLGLTKGYSQFEDLSAGLDCRGVVFVGSRETVDQYWPLFRWYCPDSEVVEVFVPDKNNFVVSWDKQNLSNGLVFNRTQHGFFSVWADVWNPHFFGGNTIHRSGLVNRSVEQLYVYPLFDNFSVSSERNIPTFMWSVYASKL